MRAKVRCAESAECLFQSLRVRVLSSRYPQKYIKVGKSLRELRTLREVNDGAGFRRGVLRGVLISTLRVPRGMADVIPELLAPHLVVIA